MPDIARRERQGNPMSGRYDRRPAVLATRRPVHRDRYDPLDAEDDLLLGTFAPARRASDRPIAIACLRLVTFLPDRPLRKVQRLRSRIVFSTLL
jgi:hypothetical protein